MLLFYYLSPEGANKKCPFPNRAFRHKSVGVGAITLSLSQTTKFRNEIQYFLNLVSEFGIVGQACEPQTTGDFNGQT
jgi:hypothetical protein